MDLRRPAERLGDFIQRGLPRDRAKLPRSLLAYPLQRLLQAVRMVDSFGVARDLGANDAIRVTIGCSAPDSADAGR